MKQSKFYQIKNITEQEYTLCGCDGRVITCPIQDIDKSASAFTIQDAKKGDVLITINNECPFIYKGYFDHSYPNSPVAYCGIDITEHLVANADKFNSRWTDKEVQPATKEQRDLLFSKMKEAGYEWDAEKKELKRINLNKAEHGKYYYCIKDYFSGGKKFASKGDVVLALRGLPIMGLEDISEYFLPVTNIQKPAEWSEEDEEMIVGLNNCLDELEEVNGWRYTYVNNKDVELDKLRNRLKSLKERHTWKPSDEQMKLLREVQQALLGKDCHNRFVHFMYELKRLKEK